MNNARLKLAGSQHIVADEQTLKQLKTMDEQILEQLTSINGSLKIIAQGFKDRKARRQAAEQRADDAELGSMIGAWEDKLVRSLRVRHPHTCDGDGSSQDVCKNFRVLTTLLKSQPSLRRAAEKLNQARRLYLTTTDTKHDIKKILKCVSAADDLTIWSD